MRFWDKLLDQLESAFEMMLPIAFVLYVILWIGILYLLFFTAWGADGREIGLVVCAVR